jgi:hypothetical protein
MQEKGEKKFYHQTGSRFCSNKEIPTQAYSCSLRSSEASKFILDPGCTDHMIRDARLLSNRKPCNLGIVQTIPANGKGDLALSTRNTMIKFNDVVACENLTHNIISISQLAAKGHTVLFDESGGYVIREANAHVLQGLKKTAFIKALKEG